MLGMLNILEPYPLAAEGMTPLNTHRLVEAMKFAFGARSEITDLASEFGDWSRQRGEVFRSKAWAEEKRRGIDDVSVGVVAWLVGVGMRCVGCMGWVVRRLEGGRGGTYVLAYTFGMLC
jgi:hypothetical protein